MALRFFIFSFLFMTMGVAMVAFANPDLDESRLREVAFSRPWLNLLYYEGSVAGPGLKSLVSKKIFFSTANGANDPLAELKFLVKNLSQPERPTADADTHLQCLFPARYRFLRKHFELAPPVQCPKLEAWKREYGPNEVRLVYASQYISNPASVFGHSFLLMPSEKRTQGLWLTMNYAAEIPPKTHPIAYAVGGITGWFGGDYSVLPFYQRLFQYGSVENRDLWVYTIHLSQEEREFLVDHLWELVHAANFTYYFLDENCAGVLLRTLAATLSDLNEHHNLPFYVHPMEVVKRLQKSGRISTADLIPSQGRVLRATLASLNSEQTNKFRLAIKNPEQPLAELDAPTSEALLHFMAFETAKNSGELPARYKSLDRAAHIARSKFYVTPMEFPKAAALTEAPHLSHDSTAVQVGVGQTNDRWMGTLGYRFAIHDLMDADAGFLKNSSVEAGALKLGFDDQHVWVQDLTLARIDNYQPFDRFDPKASWRVRLSLRDNLLTANPSDHFGYAQGAYGITLDWRGQFLYLLANLQTNAGHQLALPGLELGPEVGAILQRGRLKSAVHLGYDQAIFQTRNTHILRSGLGISWNLERNLALMSEAEWHELKNPATSGFRATVFARRYF